MSASRHSKVVIVGSGPAGHTAAIYAARANLKPVMYEGMLAGGIAAGGQLQTTTDVENFPGFPSGILGPELCERFREQSERSGTEILTETISRVDLESRPFKLWAEWTDGPDDAPAITCDALIIATGATAKRLFIKGEDAYWQRGMSACAVCDGAAPIFRGKPLVVVGGGDSACEEAMFLTKYASEVYLVHRRDKLRASDIMAKRALAHPQIKPVWNKTVVEATGDGDLLTHVVLKDTVTGEESQLATSGLFYAIGHVPNTSFLGGKVTTDSTGYIQTQSGTTLTNVPGL
ncbi:thioredoxin reductase, partial [Ramicandelaber brevisporus]